MADSITDLKIEINSLKKDMETRIRHEERLTRTIENLEVLIENLNVNYYQVNSSLLHFKDVPERLRKQEEKTIVNDLIKSGGWAILLILMAAYAGQYFSAIKEKNEYKIEKTK